MRWFNKSERPVADLSGLDAVRTSSVITAQRAYDLAAGGDLEGAITLFREEGDGYRSSVSSQARPSDALT
jgi:hypothetical protein